MMEPVVVFTTRSDIEASVVMALLDSHGIASFRSSGNPQAIWPMAVNPLDDIRIAVSAAAADEALRIIDSHREDVGTRVVRLRDEFEELQQRIGYRFKDRGLLEHALTHKSRAAEDASGGVADNEALEFLGDAVLGLIVTDFVFRRFPEEAEGRLAKLRAAAVNTSVLATVSRGLGLGEAVLLGRGEEQSGGRDKDSILADMLEALIGAVYLDGGVAHATSLVERLFGGLIEDFATRRESLDYKTSLQELTAAHLSSLPQYSVTEEGPDHDKRFTAQVRVGAEHLGTGRGRSKKEAEQAAAREAYGVLTTRLGRGEVPRGGGPDAVTSGPA